MAVYTKDDPFDFVGAQVLVAVKGRTGKLLWITGRLTEGTFSWERNIETYPVYGAFSTYNIPTEERVHIDMSLLSPFIGWREGAPDADWAKDKPQLTGEVDRASKTAEGEGEGTVELDVHRDSLPLPKGRYLPRGTED